MKTVAVQYFAILREQAGLNREAVQTNATNPRELFAQLTGRHGFTLSRDAIKVAINDEFAGWDAPLVDGDRVVFLPPVAGG